MLIAVIVLLVLAAGVVAVVAWPLVRERAVETVPPDARRLALLERRDAALQALQELELDHQAGKLTDEDAERERQTLRDEAVAALADERPGHERHHADGEHEQDDHGDRHQRARANASFVRRASRAARRGSGQMAIAKPSTRTMAESQSRLTSGFTKALIVTAPGRGEPSKTR